MGNRFVNKILVANDDDGKGARNLKITTHNLKRKLISQQFVLEFKKCGHRSRGVQKNPFNLG